MSADEGHGSGEEGDAMGGVVDRTLVSVRGATGLGRGGGGGFGRGELYTGGMGCEMREGGELGLLLSWLRWAIAGVGPKSNAIANNNPNKKRLDKIKDLKFELVIKK